MSNGGSRWIWAARRAAMNERENASVVLELPPFDAGQYQGYEFLLSGGDAVLTVLIA
jgi:hypothetical protein